MAQLFVSYSRKDEAFAHRISVDLLNLGADVWLDKNEIRVAEIWSDTIQRGLDECSYMLLIISPDSMESRNVANEWQYFIDQNKTIIPVFWKPAKVHFQLGRVQYIDFHTQEYDVALNQLQSELRRKGVQFGPPPTDDRKESAPIQTSATLAKPTQVPARPPRLQGRTIPLIGIVVILLLAGGVFALSQFGRQPSITPTPKTLAQNNTAPASTTPPRSTLTAPPTTAPTSAPITSTTPLTSDPTCRVRIAPTTLNVLSGPGLNYDQLTVLSGGTEVPVLGINNDGSWYQVNAQGTVGWVTGSFVTRLGVCSTIVSVAIPPSPTGGFGAFAQASSGGLSSGTAAPTVIATAPDTTVAQQAKQAVAQLKKLGAAATRLDPDFGTMTTVTTTQTSIVTINESRKNFILDVTYTYVPKYPSSEYFGAFFRSIGSTYYRIVVTYSGHWALYDNMVLITDGEIMQFKSSANGNNQLEIAVNGSLLYVFVNGAYATTLPLNKNRSAGDFGLIAGVYGNDLAPDNFQAYPTYKDFILQRLPERP